MNALQQYIDLYRDHGRLLREKSCETLNAPREKACTDLQDMALPRKGSENYEHTDLQELLAPDYALNIARVPLGVNPQATFRCDVPNLSRPFSCSSTTDGPKPTSPGATSLKE